MLNIQSVAEILGASSDEVLGWIHKGELQVRVIDSKLCCQPEDVTAFLDRKRIVSEHKPHHSML